MYVLNLSEEKRVLSCGIAQEGVNYGDMVITDTAPDTSNGQWTRDYIYSEEAGEYIYDPVPRPEPPEPEPTQLDVLEAQVTYTAMMTDTLLEVQDA